jgi:hypothetical protein
MTKSGKYKRTDIRASKLTLLTHRAAARHQPEGNHNQFPVAKYKYSFVRKNRKRTGIHPHHRVTSPWRREFQDGGGKENTTWTGTNANSSTKTHYSEWQSGHKSLTGRIKSYSYQFSFIIRYNTSDGKDIQLFPLPLSISHASGAYRYIKKICNILPKIDEKKTKRAEIQAPKLTILTHGAASHVSQARREDHTTNRSPSLRKKIFFLRKEPTTMIV